MKINLIEWLVTNYSLDIDLLKKEIQYTFRHKNLGNYSDKKNCSDIYFLKSGAKLIDKLFIWNHSNKTFLINFQNIEKDWFRFITSNCISDEDIYCDFNFFKIKKLKINFEG